MTAISAAWGYDSHNCLLGNGMSARLGVFLAGCHIIPDSRFHSRQWMGFKPERTGGRNRIYSRPPPPPRFIPAAMDLAMVRATERDRELVAHLACERSRLREPQVMRIGWAATAN